MALCSGPDAQAGALRNGAPFLDWVLPASMEHVRRKLKAMHDGDRQMVSILNVSVSTAFLQSKRPARRRLIKAYSPPL